MDLPPAIFFNQKKEKNVRRGGKRYWTVVAAGD